MLSKKFDNIELYNVTFGCVRNKNIESQFIKKYQTGNVGLDIGSGPDSHFKYLNNFEKVYLIDNSIEYLNAYYESKYVKICKDVFDMSLKEYVNEKPNLILCLYGVIMRCPNYLVLKDFFSMVRKIMDKNSLFIFEFTDHKGYSQRYGNTGKDFIGRYIHKYGYTNLELVWVCNLYKLKFKYIFNIVSENFNKKITEYRFPIKFESNMVKNILKEKGLNVIEEYSDFFFNRDPPDINPRRLFVCKKVQYF